MATLAEIETATKRYVDRRGLLILKVERLNTRLEEIKRQSLPAIKALAEETANAKAELASLIEGAPDLFAKPRSIIISGVKVGLQKGKGGLDYADEATVIRLIRKHLPADQQELLIQTVEKVIKKALSGLDVTTLKKLGVTVQGTGDEVLIKAVDSDVDKVVNALLKSESGEPDLEEVA
jgi:hypothetical protein